MKQYSLKMGFIWVAFMASTWLGSRFSHLQFGNSIYFAGFFQFAVFVLLRWFVVKSNPQNPNSSIRRLMIASMLRMLFILMFLVITMINQGKANIPWTIVYCLYFILFLVFDFSEKHTNLRPDSERAEKIQNAS